MIFDKIEKVFSELTEKTMIEYEETQINFKKYITIIDCLINEFTKVNVHRDSCVALKISRGDICFLLSAALSKINCFVMIIDSTISDFELKNLLHEYAPNILITDKSYLLLNEFEKINNNIFSMNLNLEVNIYANRKINDWRICDLVQDRGFIFFTSGSTKVPKAVFRTQENVYEDAINNIEYFGISSLDKVLCATSFSHVYGFGSGSMPYLLAGVTVRFIKPASTFSVLRESLKGSTIFVGLPIHYTLLSNNLEGQLPIRIALCAGSGISSQLIDNCYSKLSIYINNMYGMSETGGITTLYGNITADNMYSHGKPLTNVSIKLGEMIDQVPDASRPLYKILVKSKSISPGYFDTQDKKFIHSTFADEWFDTNDLGYIGKKGELHVICRNDIMINCSGKKINPLEIESVILEYPSITETIVVGKKDVLRGEVIVAYIVSQEEIDIKKLIQLCSKKLAVYKIPKEIYQITNIPKTKTGKIIRKALM